ncbi:MAG: hypothetical protein ABI725_04265 [Chloroflexota bacterium]
MTTPPVVSGSTPVGFTRYTSTDNSFAIAVPTDWTATSFDSGDKLFEASSPSGAAVGNLTCQLTVTGGAVRDQSMEMYAASLAASLGGEVFQTRMGDQPAMGFALGRFNSSFLPVSDGSGDIWDLNCSTPLGYGSADQLFSQIRGTFEAGPNPPRRARVATPSPPIATPSPGYVSLTFSGDWDAQVVGIWHGTCNQLILVDGSKSLYAQVWPDDVEGGAAFMDFSADPSGLSFNDPQFRNFEWTNSDAGSVTVANNKISISVKAKDVLGARVTVRGAITCPA